LVRREIADDDDRTGDPLKRSVGNEGYTHPRRVTMARQVPDNGLI
jgi:hypothetical protein